MVKQLPAVAKKDFKLDGVLYKKGHVVDYSKWPKHTQFQLRSFLVFTKKNVKKAERIVTAKEQENKSCSVPVDALLSPAKGFLNIAGLKSKFFKKTDVTKG